MSVQYSESIYIVAVSPERASEIRESIQLRGFDKTKCYPLEKAAAIVAAQPPDLLILDPEGHLEQANKVIASCSSHVPVIFLADSFEEETFLTCFDAGAKDYLIKPVNNSYLISRVLVALGEKQLIQQLKQRDEILMDLGVFGQNSGVFTTEYLVKMLRKELDEFPAGETPAISLLMIAIEGVDPTLMREPVFRKGLYEDAAKVLKTCCRGTDIIAEYFEDKFAVIMPRTGQEGVQSLSNRVLARLDGYKVKYDGREIPIHVRMGAADFSGCLHYEDLINKATEGLKQAQQENAQFQMV